MSVCQLSCVNQGSSTILEYHGPYPQYKETKRQQKTTEGPDTRESRLKRQFREHEQEER